MENNNRLAHRYWKKGLIILAGIWVVIFLVAAGEAIHTRISVPAHHQTRTDLLETKRSLAQTHDQLDRVEVWAECLVREKERLAEYTWYLLAEYRRPGTTESQDALARCSDPR